MVDEKRKRLFLHNLSQPSQQRAQAQAGLQSISLRKDQILPFFRKVETLILEHELSSATLNYWSSNDASWMKPAKGDLLELSQVSSSITSFSEERDDELDEFCFACLSSELSVVVYGFALEATGEALQYELAGTLDPQLVKRVLQGLSPYLEFIDPLDAHKLDAAISRISSQKTMPHFMNSLQHNWGELNMPESKIPARLAEKATPAVAAAANTEEQLWIRISSNYPYPIANPFRALDSITNASEKYKEQLKLIENLLALLAGICLSISAQNEPKILADLRDYVSHGVSMGHWREIIRKCVTAWKSSSAKEIPLAKSISALRIELTERGFGKAVEQLIRARNDFAHHRGPTAESQLELETVRLGEFLKDAIKLTEFLCEHPIRIVKAIDVLPSGAIKMTCLKAIGDHPVLRQEELCLGRGFPKGHLILDTGDSNWLSLYPFLTQDICSSCGTMEIYHLDKWRYEKDRIQVRSFERGHAQESTAISHVLKAMVVSVP
jgi:hypothetical protein